MRAVTARVIATGTVAGALGFAVVSLPFVVLDFVTGRGAGFTPSLIGSALFRGVVEGCSVRPDWSLAMGYSALHLVAFLALGLLSAGLFALIAARPYAVMAALFAFITASFLFYQGVLGVLAPVAGCFSLYYVMAASTAAAVAMVGYLGRENRDVLREVTRPENQ